MAGEQLSSDSKADQDYSLRRQLSQLTRGYRVRLVGIVGLSFVSGFAEALVLLVVARVAFALANTGSDVPVAFGPFSGAELSVPELIAVAALLVGLRFGVQMLVVSEQSALYSNVLTEVRCLLVSDYLSASWATQSEDRDGRLQEMASGFAVSAAGQVNSLAAFLGASCSLLAMLVTALFANALGTLVIGLAAVGLIAMMRPFRSAVRMRSWRNSNAGLAYATAVSEAATMMQEIHVFGVGDATSGRLGELADESRKTTLRWQRLSGLIPNLFQSLALLVVVGAIGLVYALGSTRLASLGAVVLIGIRALSYGSSVQGTYQSLHSSAPYMSTLMTEHERYVSSALPSGERRLERIDEVAGASLSYSYDSTGRFALSDMSFAARRGQIVGIVGPSGAGKSTFVQLVLRLRDPTSGQLLVNGVDAREYCADDWTRLVAFVPQDSHLFSGTVRDNIRFFRSEITDEAVEQAAIRAHLHEEIVRWPAGYDTPVGEQGRKLSGGQRQRLTIARALAGEPDVVVLDEPTSSLDVKSESVIRETMASTAKEALVFVVAHRLSTLDLCDRIMVIQDGQLRAFDEPRILEQSSAFYREALELSGLR